MAHAIGLARGIIGNSGHQGADLRHALVDPVERVPGFADQCHPGTDLIGTGENPRLDVVRRLGRPLGERADLGGDDGKALACIARARRFHPGIEGQEIGLERDPVDHADDLGDFGRGLLDPAHRRAGAVDHCTAVARIVPGPFDRARRLRRAAGGIADGSGDLLDRRRGFLQAGRLLFGPLRQVV